MASLVKNIEKEFLLNTAKREGASITMNSGGGEWTVRIVDVSTRGVTFAHEIPLRLLRKGVSYDFHYDVRGQTIAFKTPILEPGERRFMVAIPDKMYKNLSRRYTRLPPPGDLAASFSFAGERYDLDFPSSTAFNPDVEPQASADFDPADLKGLMLEFERKALAIGSERGIIMFKDRDPASPEERLSAQTGRCFYLPTIMSGIPRSDPFAERSILTRDDFIGWFVETGLEQGYAEDEVTRFERSKRSAGILSELLVPILFQDYTIGCATIINKQPGKPAFDLRAVETFMSFARVFAWSLKLHGYFKDSPKLADDFLPQVVDVSAGGLLFACQDPKLIQALKENLPVTVLLASKHRNIDAAGVIRRHYIGGQEGFFGIEFTVMAPEDFRFLFEYLYGKPFTDEESDSVEGVRLQTP
ncbi:MAG: PilZ domain-containing protein [Spirochaetota bacterium]